MGNFSKTQNCILLFRPMPRTRLAGWPTTDTDTTWNSDEDNESYYTESYNWLVALEIIIVCWIVWKMKLNRHVPTDQKGAEEEDAQVLLIPLLLISILSSLVPRQRVLYFSWSAWEPRDPDKNNVLDFTWTSSWTSLLGPTSATRRSD